MTDPANTASVAGHVRRYVNAHIIDANSGKLQICVLDEPGPGGANHQYLVRAPNDSVYQLVLFQNGGINEVGVNGTTHEVLLAIIIDRLKAFQKGPFPCRENALALTKCEEALHWLHHRTKERLARMVEGKLEA